VFVEHMFTFGSFKCTKFHTFVTAVKWCVRVYQCPVLSSSVSCEWSVLVSLQKSLICY